MNKDINKADMLIVILINPMPLKCKKGFLNVFLIASFCMQISVFFQMSLVIYCVYMFGKSY